MTLAKKGCEVALQRAFVVRQQQRGQRGIVDRDGDPGPLLDVNADVFIHNGFDYFISRSPRRKSGWSLLVMNSVNVL